MKPIIYTGLSLLLAAVPAVAQDLSTEVVVDRTIQPKERAASRLGGITPVLELSTPRTPSLSTARYSTLSPLTRSYTRLDPASGAMAAEKSPYKGYAALGYFPSLNIGASAGYRFIDNEKMTLGADLQFDGERYKPFDGWYERREFSEWYTRVGVDFSYRPAKDKQLSVALDYNFLKQRTVAWDWQNVNTIGLDLGWEAAYEDINYYVSLSENFEKSGDVNMLDMFEGAGKPKPLDGLTQNALGIKAGASYSLDASSRIGIDLNGDFIHTNNPELKNEFVPHNLIGTMGVKPYYALNMGNISALVGVKLDFGVNDEAKMHVAPDIRLQWEATSQLGVWINAGGGDVLNPFSAVRQMTDYQVFKYGYRRSNIPLMLEGGFNFGPFSGFTAQIYGGYAKANRWLMAYNLALENHWVNVKGWHAGLKLGYRWRMLDFNAGAEIAPSDFDKAWIYNYDRAKYIITAGVDVTPIDKLTIGASYEFRGHRGYSFDPDEWYSLGCVSNLAVHAEYKLLPWFTIFGRGENLLGRRYDILGLLPSQKQHGAVGVALKF